MRGVRRWSKFLPWPPFWTLSESTLRKKQRKISNNTLKRAKFKDGPLNYIWFDMGIAWLFLKATTGCLQISSPSTTRLFHCHMQLCWPITNPWSYIVMPKSVSPVLVYEVVRKWETHKFLPLKTSVCNFYQNFNIHALRCDFLYIHDDQVHRLASSP